MVDILYLAANRREFTVATMAALLRNTNWNKVERLVIYDDSSGDGTRTVLEESALACPAPVYLRGGTYGSPIIVMNDYIQRGSCAAIFAKVDNDAMLPPGWLDIALAVMEANPDLGLLGLEAQDVPQDSACGWVPAPRIGGIGLMRTMLFTEPLEPRAIYGGFDGWQQTHPEIIKGWLSPSIPMFLLDRLPIEPWATFSKGYIAMGWQRPWIQYKVTDSRLWAWWGGS